MTRKSFTAITAVLLGLSACTSDTSNESTPTSTVAAAKGGGNGGGGGGGGNGGGTPVTPPPAPTPPPPPARPTNPMTGTWTGEQRYGPGPADARFWTMTLTQQGVAATGRLRIEQFTANGGKTNLDTGNLSATATLEGDSLTIYIRPQGREASYSTFIGTLSADGKTMQGVNWVPTVPASTLGGVMTLVKGK